MKQCVKPLSCFSGLTFVPHLYDAMPGIFDGSALKASSTALICSFVAPSLNLNDTTCKSSPFVVVAGWFWFANAKTATPAMNTPAIINRTLCTGNSIAVPFDNTNGAEGSPAPTPPQAGGRPPSITRGRRINDGRQKGGSWIVHDGKPKEGFEPSTPALRKRPRLRQKAR